MPARARKSPQLLRTPPESARRVFYVAPRLFPRLAQEVDTTPAPPLSAPRPPTAGASERAGLRGLPWPVTSVSSLEFEVTQVFKLIKTAPAVVAGNGQVVVATPAGTLYGLPNPDNAGVSWVSQPTGFPAGGWVEGGSDDEKDNSCCYDLLLDQGNNIYAVITERNLLDGRVYAYQPGGQVSKWGTPLRRPADQPAAAGSLPHFGARSGRGRRAFCAHVQPAHQGGHGYCRHGYGRDDQCVPRRRPRRVPRLLRLWQRHGQRVDRQHQRCRRHVHARKPGGRVRRAGLEQELAFACVVIE